MSTNVLGFRNQATVSFWALDSLPSQLNENSYPERPKWAVSHSLEPGFEQGHIVLCVCSIVWIMDSVLDRWARRSILALSLMSVELLWEDVCSGYDYGPVILSFATGVTGL